MEEDTVATITGQDGTTTQYKSFDEAVSKANNGDTIEVIKIPLPALISETN